jgi:Tfp pilus assembly protein PilV
MEMLTQDQIATGLIHEKLIKYFLKNMIRKFNKTNCENGFTYIDVMIAIVICMVGVLAMTAALTTNLVRSHNMGNQAVAKQLATSAIESIFSAREIARSGAIEGWDSIGNVGTNPVNGTPKGIFMVDWRPVRANGGADGVIGTIDDACDAPGDCGANANNPVQLRFERKITITDINNSAFTTIRKRRVDVEVRYKLQNTYFQEKLSTIIADYR